MQHAPSLEIQGPIATLCLQRPASANKITPDDLAVLRHHVDTVNRTESVLLLVLRSTGKHFCAGYDITQVSGSQTEGQGFGDMVDAIENCRAVTLAVVQGGCMAAPPTWCWHATSAWGHRLSRCSCQRLAWGCITT